MIVNSDTYVPSLRWRQGEYQALFRLSNHAKDRVVPFILIPDVEFDFEEWAPKKSVHEHVFPFPKRFMSKWGGRPAWIDFDPNIQEKLMSDGRMTVSYVFDELRLLGCKGVPILSLDHPQAVIAAVSQVIHQDGQGLGIRARIEHIMKPSCNNDIAKLIASVGLNAEDVDLIVDLGAPAYEPYEDFSDAIVAIMSAFGDLYKFRSYVVIGSAFPESVTLDKPGGDISRHDWLFYKVLRGKIPPSERVPSFGDYTIVNPAFTPRDMRLIKSGGKVVYAGDSHWHIRKGGAFRDNPSQMHDHCDHIQSLPIFRGAGFSHGDDIIYKCATKAVGHGNQTVWKGVGINHHIMQVLDDISILAAVA